MTQGQEAERVGMLNRERRYALKKKAGRKSRPDLRTWWTQLIREDHLQLFHDFFFWMSLGDRQFLDQQRTRRVEHLALAERQFLVALQHQQIAQHLGDFEWRTGFDLFGVFAVATVPRLRIDLDLALTQNTVDFFHHIFADYAAQSDRLDVLRRNHDSHLFGAENSQHVKTPLGPGNDPHLDVFDYGHPMGGVNHLLTFLERQTHCDSGIRRQAIDFGHGLMTAQSWVHYRSDQPGM